MITENFSNCPSSSLVVVQLVASGSIPLECKVAVKSVVQSQDLDVPRPVHTHHPRSKGLKDFCIFAVRIYVKAWMTAPLATSAPQNDLDLLKAVIKYEDVNLNISKAVAKKFANHLWYLSEELATLALFDDCVDIAVKRQMV